MSLDPVRHIGARQQIGWTRSLMPGQSETERREANGKSGMVCEYCQHCFLSAWNTEPSESILELPGPSR